MESGLGVVREVPLSLRAPAPRLGRAEIEAIVSSGRRLLVQGGMGVHVSDGLAGKVAAIRGRYLVGAGTISEILE